jgi:succinate dehydrogenase flavoprotein subunit
VLDNLYITRILVRDNVVFGAYDFDLDTGGRCVIRADAVILAAGGHPRIWRRTS